VTRASRRLRSGMTGPDHLDDVPNIAQPGSLPLRAAIRSEAGPT
jgi:hypothetical protein